MQRTIKTPVTFSGAGLHLGKKQFIQLYPAAVNTGIVFKHLKSQTIIPALWKNIKTLPLCTCIVNPNAPDIYIRTIEHLLAACYANKISNLLIEIEGLEVPILDGSGLLFDQKLKDNICIQNSPRKQIKITKTREYKESEQRWIKIEPANTLFIDIQIELNKFGVLRWQGEMTPEICQQDIIQARTFGRLRNGLLAKLTYFKKDPICLGANFNSSLILVGNKAINKGGMRLSNEPIKHRVLDLLGDLMLAGGDIQGKITASSTAHRLNHQLLKKILSATNEH